MTLLQGGHKKSSHQVRIDNTVGDVREAGTCGSDSSGPLGRLDADYGTGVEHAIVRPEGSPSVAYLNDGTAIPPIRRSSYQCQAPSRGSGA